MKASSISTEDNPKNMFVLSSPPVRYFTYWPRPLSTVKARPRHIYYCDICTIAVQDKYIFGNNCQAYF